LLCHKSQLSEEVGPWIYDWAKRIGESAGMAYAEAFRVIKLVREEEDEAVEEETVTADGEVSAESAQAQG